MRLFLSTFVNRIDKKGRVSVPAGFRTVLAGLMQEAAAKAAKDNGKDEGFQGIVAYPSFIHPCVEACGLPRLESLYRSMEALDPFSEERDAFATTILGGSEQLGFDSEGRVLLPPRLMTVAGLEDQALFVGKGETFEIWHPERFAAYAEKARALALAQRGALRASPANPSVKGCTA